MQATLLWLALVLAVAYSQEFVKVNEYNNEWTTENQEYSSLSCWTPKACSECFILGSVCLVDSVIAPDYSVLIWKGLSEAVASPISYTQVWKDSTQDAFLVELNCPSGYSAMGAIATTSFPPLQQDKYKCVSNELVAVSNSDEALFELVDSHSKKTLRVSYSHNPFITALIIPSSSPSSPSSSSPSSPSSIPSPLSFPLAPDQLDVAGERSNKSKRITCVNGDDTFGVCICYQGWTGLTCETVCPAITIITTPTRETCVNAKDGTVRVQASSALSGLFVRFGSTSYPLDYTFTSLAPGSYMFYAISDTCQNSASVVINAANPLKVRLQSTTPVCGTNDGYISFIAEGGTGTGYQHFIDYANVGILSSYSNIGPGAHLLQVYDSNDCVAAQTINMARAVSVSASVAPPPCWYSSTGLVTITANSGNPPFTYSFANRPYNTSNVYEATAGQYGIKAKDMFGCVSDTIFATVTPPSMITMNATSLDDACGKAVGEVTISPGGGAGGYQIDFDNRGYSSMLKYTGLLSGTYPLSIKDANGCTKSLTVDVGLVPTLVVSTNVFPASCFNTATGSVIISTTGGWGNKRYAVDQSSTFVMTNIFEGLAPGPHTAYATDADGCVSHQEFIVGQPSEISFGISPTPCLCQGVSDGKAAIVISGGTSPYSFTFSGVAIGTFTAGATITQNGLAPGVYFFNATDSKGCSKIGSVTIQTSAYGLSYTLTPMDPPCAYANTGSLIITPYGGSSGLYTTNFQNVDYGSQTMFSGLGAGTYSWVIRDGLGCLVSGQQTLTAPSAVVAKILSKPEPECSDSQSNVILGAEGGAGGYTISFDYGNYGYTFSYILGEGTYTFTIRDQNGCASQPTSFDILAPDPIALDYTEQIPLCYGEAGSFTVTATGGRPGYSYSLDGVVYSTNPYFATVAGVFMYHIFVKDSSGCLADTWANLPLPTQLVVGATSVNPTLCTSPTGSITVSATGGIPPYKYSIDGVNYVTTAEFAPVTAGTYTYYVMDSNGCVQYNTITLTPPDNSVTATYSKVDLLCATKSTGSITVTASAGAAPYSYSIDGSTFYASNIFSDLPADTYSIVVQDSNMCSYTLSAIEIFSPTELQVLATPKSYMCNDNTSAYIAITASGGTPPYFYAFDSHPATPNSLSQQLTLGDHSYAVIDANGCTSEGSIQITDPGVGLGMTVHVYEVCAGNDGKIIAVARGGSGEGYTYSLDGQNFGVNNVFEGLSVGEYVMYVQDSLGCVKSSGILPVTSPVVQTSTSTSWQCVSGTITVNVTTPFYAPYSYSLDGITYSESNTFAQLQPNTYTVYIKTFAGCIVTKIVELLRPLDISATYSVSDTSCHSTTDGAVSITAVGGTGTFTYSLDGSPFTAVAEYGGLSAGNHTFVVRDDNQCSATGTFTVAQAPKITVALTATQLVCSYDKSEVSSTVSGGSGPYTYSVDGSNYQSSPIFYLTGGSYMYYVKDTKQCVASVTDTIPRPPAMLVSATQTPATCTQIGQISFVVDQANLPVQYSVNSSNFVSTPIFNEPRGLYSWTVKDSNGCIATGSIFVQEVCTPCAPGYAGRGGDDCTDIDECAIPNNCSSNARCFNTIGSYNCFCNAGYQGNGFSCSDINECLTLNGGCAFNAICTNTDGGRLCGSCPPGTVGDGYTSCYTTCGNGTCDGVENCVNCYQDCRKITCDICGDGTCDRSIGENCSTCFEDCGPCMQPVCGNNCTGNGVCVNGQCVCNGTWSGPTCNIQKSQPVTVAVNTTKPDISVTTITVPAGSATTSQSSTTSPTPAPTKNLKFVIGVKGIAELDKNGMKVRYEDISNIGFEFQTELNGVNNTKFLYGGTLANGAYVNVTIWQFNDPTTIVEFANTSTTFLQNGVKIGVKVGLWPFQSMENQLGIHMESTIDDAGASPRVINNKDERGSLVWLSVTTADRVSLYGQFLDKAVIDGRIRTISYDLNDDNTITAKLPHFWHEAEMDPNFSVLLGESESAKPDDPNSKNGGAAGMDKKAIIIAIPVSVGVVLLIAAIACFVVPRTRLWCQVQESQEDYRKSGQLSKAEFENLSFEKRASMEVTTSSGKFTVHINDDYYTNN